MLNGRELYEEGVITNVEEENVAQHGIDLNVVGIQSLNAGSHGVIPLHGKTVVSDYDEVPLSEIKVGNINDGFREVDGWKLSPGTYDVKMKQGCRIPADKMLLIRQRSSLLRNGAILHSSVFDAGFETEHIGTVLVVTHPIAIEKGARICQIYAHQCDPIDDKDLYDGQFQNDKQRKKQDHV